MLCYALYRLDPDLNGTMLLAPRGESFRLPHSTIPSCYSEAAIPPWAQNMPGQHRYNLYAVGALKSEDT